MIIRSKDKVQVNGKNKPVVSGIIKRTESANKSIQ